MKRVLTLFFFLQFALIFCLGFSSPVRATLTSASDTLSNARLSFVSPLGQSASASTTTITSSSDLTNLFSRDAVCFTDQNLNSCSGDTTYKVVNVPSQTSRTFEISPALLTDLTTSNIILAAQSAIHRVVFTTSISVTNPVFEVQIPGSLTDLVSNSGFALGGLTANDIDCSVGTASVTPQALTGSNYHSIKCTVNGTVNAGTQITIRIGKTHSLINPAPNSSHSLGNADIYRIAIYEYDSSGNLIDQTKIKAAPIEGVLVSGNVVNPSLIQRFVLFGYTSPHALVTLNLSEAVYQAYADGTGYFNFVNPIQFSSATKEPCLSSQDQLGRLSSPLCLAPIPPVQDVNIGPVIMPPTISLDKPHYYVGDEVLLSGQTIPTTSVNLFLFTKNSSPSLANLSLIKPVEAFIFPQFLSQADNGGNFSVELPSSAAKDYRLFVTTNFQNHTSPQSIILNLSILPIWMIIIEFLRLLWSIITNRLIELIIIVELMALIFYIVRRYLHPHAISKTRALILRQPIALIKENTDLIKEDTDIVEV